MNTRDQNRYRMFTSVRGTLATHETDNTWTKIPAFVTAVGELDTVITGVALQLEVLAVPTGASASKATALGALVASAHEIAAATHAYATEAGDDELAAGADFAPTYLAKGTAASVVARCTKIASLASENLEALAEYNITQAKLTAFTKKIAAFEKVSPKPRQGVAKRSAANKGLARLLDQGRNILTRRVDRLMVQFKASAPEFFAEYKTARKIVNAPGIQSGHSAIISADTKPADLLKAA